MPTSPKKSWLHRVARVSSPQSSLQNESASELSYEDRMIRNRKDLCFKVAGKDSTGHDAYYFVLIEPAKKEAFFKKKVGDNYNIEDYGKVIYSAYGTKVPRDVKLWLKEKYGFDNLEIEDTNDDDDITFNINDFWERDDDNNDKV